MGGKPNFLNNGAKVHFCLHQRELTGENLAREKEGLMPCGWNDSAGMGLLKRMDPGSSQWCSVKGREKMNTNQNTGNSTHTKKVVLSSPYRSPSPLPTAGHSPGQPSVGSMGWDQVVCTAASSPSGAVMLWLAGARWLLRNSSYLEEMLSLS